MNAPPSTPADRPTIVCLCGSTRYYDAFQRANFAETMAGRIVLSVGFYPHSAGQAHGEWIGITPEEKEDLDRLHLRKIDLCDEILVLNQDDYVGQSTMRELGYARAAGKRVRWLGRSVHALPGEVQP
jgi:nucleoside 2-deoxyribosyltransferase